MSRCQVRFSKVNSVNKLKVKGKVQLRKDYYKAVINVFKSLVMPSPVEGEQGEV